MDRYEYEAARQTPTSTLIEAVVRSNGHFDHAGGFAGLARLRRRAGLPIALHPLVWTHRRIALPGSAAWELPTLGRSALEGGVELPSVM